MAKSLEDLSPPPFSPRSPFVAVLLSLFTPGLGQMYNGQHKKGILLFVLVLLVPALFGWTRFIVFFEGLVALVMLLAAIRLYAIIDALVQARKLKYFQETRFDRWYTYLLTGLAMLAILFFYDHGAVLGIFPTRTAADAMYPTLQANDIVVTDLRAYEQDSIDYGHIVMFERPNGERWMFRVVGLPLDTVEIHQHHAKINGTFVQAERIRDTAYDRLPAKEYDITLPNGHRHRTIIFSQFSEGDQADMEAFVVPAGTCFVMGDHRANAMDSRYIGPVQRASILGRVVYTYWGESPDRINLNLREQ